MTRSLSALLFVLAIAVAAASPTHAAEAGSAKKAGSMKKEMAKPAISRAYLHNYNLPGSGVALEGYCPVCYFAVNKAVKGTPEFQADYNGVTYYFVKEAAKQAFVKEPEKYLPAYGGWCATGMAIQDKFPVDPTNFKVVDGRLFLFLTNKNVDAQKIWNKGNEKELIAKADAHWKKITAK